MLAVTLGPGEGVAELVTLAKSNPGKLNYAASSTGSAPHLAGVEFASRAGVEWQYIPYKGGAQAITDVVGGQADLLFNGMLATYPQVKNGKLRILAVSSGKRKLPPFPRCRPSPKAAMRDSRPAPGRASSRRRARRSEIVAKLGARSSTRSSPRTEMKEKLAAQGAEVRAMKQRRSSSAVHRHARRIAGPRYVKAAGIKAE